MGHAVSYGLEPRASFEKILKIQRTIILPKEMKEHIEQDTHIPTRQ
jgi:hypothetical protein